MRFEQLLLDKEIRKKKMIRVNDEEKVLGKKRKDFWNETCFHKDSLRPVRMRNSL